MTVEKKKEGPLDLPPPFFHIATGAERRMPSRTFSVESHGSIEEEGKHGVLQLSVAAETRVEPASQFSKS